MGTFSWLTSDTEESILAADYNDGDPQTVYLLQPNGQPPIAESAYEGYGVFGGVNAYDWVARANIPAERLASLTPGEICSVGIRLCHGQILKDTITGAKLSIFHDGAKIIDPEVIEHLGLSYAAPLPGYDGKSANELVAEKRLIPVPYEPEFPLKFSFDPAAIYEDLPAAADCPYQGGLIAKD